MKDGSRRTAGMALALGVALLIAAIYLPPSRAEEDSIQRIRFRSLSSVEGGVLLEIEFPEGFTNRVDVFAAPLGLGAGALRWRCLAQGLSPAQAASWTCVRTELDGMMYAIGDAATDTDLDGLSDAYEIFVALTNPANPYTHGDGLADAEGDPDGDGLSILDEYFLGTHPHQPCEWSTPDALGMEWFTVIGN